MTPAEARARWVEVLRSGTFDQGSGQLAFDGRYCCLGVACELYQTEGPGDLKVESFNYVQDTEEGEPHPPSKRYDGEDNYLPPKVQAWLGLRTRMGMFDHDPFGDGITEDTTLANLNDDEKPFSYIADVIEKQPPGLLDQPTNHQQEATQS